MASTPEYNRKRYLEKREHILETNKKWREANREKKNLLTRAYDCANKPIRAANEARRRARKFNATPSWLTEEDHENIRKIYEYAWSIGYHVDHIVPLKHNKVCGLHVPWNLQPLSAKENMIKHNTFEVI